MVRSRLRSVTEPIRERIPEPPDIDPPSVRERLPDRDALGRAGTLLAVVGSALALVGVLVRYLSNRGADDEAVEELEPEPEQPEPEPHTWDWEGPRIAPLAGVCGLVVMRLYVEWLGENADDGA